MAETTIAEYTDTTLKGEGVFDTMMRGVKAHLEEEFSKNRIKGPEYSSVYLGAMQSVMDHALRFLLEKDSAYQQAELAKAQVVSEGKRQALLDQELLKLVAETTLVEKQICKLEAEFDVLMEQKLKTINETALLAQKKVTEEAQTSGLNVDETSVIGRQKTLYKAQSDGFARDAEQKAAKLMVDTWNVRRTTDPGTVWDSTNKLSDADVGSVVGKLMTGINA